MKVSVLGFPWDEQSSYLRGAAQGPAQIREIIACGASNLCSEDGIDLAQDERFALCEDIALDEGGPALGQIEAKVAETLSRDERVLALGGDHAITYPILRAYAKRYPDLNILHFDAHPDLYEEFEGNALSHACPFARIMEEGLARHLTQVGIRCANAHQRGQIERFGVEVIEARQVGPELRLELEGPLYLSFDLDALDPAYAPGVSHHEPGGLSVRQVLDIIQAIDVPLVGADIVELNPLRDEHDRTAAVAVKLMKEIAAKMLSGG